MTLASNSLVGGTYQGSKLEGKGESERMILAS